MVDEITSVGGTAIAAVGSVTDVDFLADMVRQDRVANTDAIGVVVNNAGIIDSAMALKMSADQWHRVLDVNLTGAFNVLQAVGPSFVTRSQEEPDLRCVGHIVNVSSVAGLRGTMGQVNYGAAKAGLIGLTMSIAREWARYRVVSNAVAFGSVETRMTETMRTDERFKDKLLAEILLGRHATADEVARAILFLASPDADYITGQTLNVSGGLHIGY